MRNHDLGIFEDYTGPDNPVTKTLFATQGGGTVIRVGDRFQFLDPPQFGEFNPGDLMPEEWGVVPISEVPIEPEETPKLEESSPQEGSWYED